MRLSIAITLSISGTLKLQAGLGDDAHRLAEPDHERLLGLIDGEQRRIAEHDRGENEDEDDAAGDTESHRVPPRLRLRRLRPAAAVR